MEFLLRAKHWHIFLLIVCLPFLGGIAFVASIINTVVHTDRPDPAVIFDNFGFLPLILLLPLAVKIAWQWAVAVRLQKFAPPGILLKDTTFKILIFCIIGFYFLFFGAFFSLFKNFFMLAQQGGQPDPRYFMGFFALVPLSLFNTFCMFYSYYFAAKVYKTVELKRPVNFGDFVLEAVLIWFFFIGVWILQPKINKMLDQGDFPQDPAATIPAQGSF